MAVARKTPDRLEREVTVDGKDVVQLWTVVHDDGQNLIVERNDERQTVSRLDVADPDSAWVVPGGSDV